jgi:hypothetical protein
MSDLLRTVINKCLPPGSAWKVAPDSDLDNLYDGAAENWEIIRLFLADLKNIRDPQKTSYLDDLELEFGVVDNGTLTEQERRDRLEPIMFNRDVTGTIDDMQAALDGSGFGMLVHNNDPPVDPSLFIDEDFYVYCAGDDAFCGNENAICGSAGGFLIVNGDITIQTPDFDILAGGQNAFCGNQLAICGSFIGTLSTPVLYDVPDNPGYWGLIFFIGGAATRDPVTDEITAIASVQIPIDRRDELIRLIVKNKPLHSWCGLIVEFV